MNKVALGKTEYHLFYSLLCFEDADYNKSAAQLQSSQLLFSSSCAFVFGALAV